MTSLQAVKTQQAAPVRMESLAGGDISQIEGAWRQLADSQGDVHPSLGPEWTSLWFAQQRRSGLGHTSISMLFAFWRDDALIAVIPAHRTTLRIGVVRVAAWLRVGIGSEVIEAAPLLIKRGEELSVIRSLNGHLHHEEVDVVFWSGLPRDAVATLELLTDPSFVTENAFAMLTLPLPGSWDALERRLSRKMRKTLRTNRRMQERAGLTQSLVVSSGTGARNAITRFFALHAVGKRAAQRAGRERFASEDARAKLMQLVDLEIGAGRLRVFELLVKGEVVATRIGILSREVMYLHLFASKVMESRANALTLLTEEILRHAITSRFLAVHLAASSTPSNLRWSPAERPLLQVSQWRATWRAKALRTLRPVRRSLLWPIRQLRGTAGTSAATMPEELVPANRLSEMMQTGPTRALLRR